MTPSGQPRMNIRRCVLGAFLRDLSQAQQFFEGVESFAFVSLIAREDFGQNFGGALMGKPQGWNFRETTTLSPQSSKSLDCPRSRSFRRPVCAENLILVDCVTESPNVNGDDRAALLLPDPAHLAVQVEEPT